MSLRPVPAASARQKGGVWRRFLASALLDSGYACVQRLCAYSSQWDSCLLPATKLVSSTNLCCQRSRCVSAAPRSKSSPYINEPLGTHWIKTFRLNPLNFSVTYSKTLLHVSAQKAHQRASSFYPSAVGSVKVAYFMLIFCNRCPWFSLSHCRHEELCSFGSWATGGLRWDKRGPRWRKPRDALSP